jgi:hypothetical protein
MGRRHFSDLFLPTPSIAIGQLEKGKTGRGMTSALVFEKGEHI